MRGQLLYLIGLVNLTNYIYQFITFFSHDWTIVLAVFFFLFVFSLVFFLPCSPPPRATFDITAIFLLSHRCKSMRMKLPQIWNEGGGTFPISSFQILNEDKVPLSFIHFLCGMKEELPFVPNLELETKGSKSGTNGSSPLFQIPNEINESLIFFYIFEVEKKWRQLRAATLAQRCRTLTN